MRRSLFIALITLIAAGCTPAPPDDVGAPSQASAQSSAQSSQPAPLAQEAVQEALGGTEWDADAPAPLLLLPEAEAALLRLRAPQAGFPKVIAVRATLALRHHPTPRVYDALLATVTARTHPRLVAASLDTLARAFALSDGPALRATMTPLLSDNDPEVRAAARVGLARIRASRWIND